jgi:hypothetical protein
MRSQAESKAPIVADLLLSRFRSFNEMRGMIRKNFAREVPTL